MMVQACKGVIRRRGQGLGSQESAPWNVLHRAQGPTKCATQQSASSINLAAGCDAHSRYPAVPTLQAAQRATMGPASWLISVPTTMPMPLVRPSLHERCGCRCRWGGQAGCRVGCIWMDLQQTACTLQLQACHHHHRQPSHTPAAHLKTKRVPGVRYSGRCRKRKRTQARSPERRRGLSMATTRADCRTISQWITACVGCAGWWRCMWGGLDGVPIPQLWNSPPTAMRPTAHSHTHVPGSAAGWWWSA